MANKQLIELATKVATKKAEREDKYEFAQVMEALRQKGATNPQVHWEINEIITRTADEILKPRMDFLDYVAEIQRVDHGQKIEFQVPGRTKMKMQFTGRGTTVDYQRVGFRNKFSAEPMKVQGGAYYEIDQLLAGNVDGFTGVVDSLVKNMEDKITSKAIMVLAAAPVPPVNRWVGTNITPANFSSVASVIQRYDRNVACIADIDFAKKLAGFIGAEYMSERMKEFKNENGYFTTVDSVDVIVFNNPFADDDVDNTKLAAPRKYAYLVPVGAERPLKIGFEGGLVQYTDTDINSERVFLKVGQKLSVDLFHDMRNIGILQDNAL